MPKLKTHRGAAKRFSLTGKGRVKRKKAYTSHILTSKSAKTKRKLHEPAYVDKATKLESKGSFPIYNERYLKILRRT